MGFADNYGVGNANVIVATNDTINIVVESEIKKLGYNANLNHIDVSCVTNMDSLFVDSKFNGDISEWDVRNVKDMKNMFTNSKFNGDISEWDVSKVERMDGMFVDSKFNGDISKWNVGNVTNMQLMLCRSEFNGDISKWNVRNIKNMINMFAFSQFNGDISDWDINMDNIIAINSNTFKFAPYERYRLVTHSIFYESKLTTDKYPRAAFEYMIKNGYKL